MDWITEQIAIGNFLDAVIQRPTFHAILCLKEGCPCGQRDDVEVLSIPLIDGPGNATDDILEGLQFIDDRVAEGQKVLVHCHAGRSRSVSLVAAYLIK